MLPLADPSLTNVRGRRSRPTRPSFGTVVRTSRSTRTRDSRSPSTRMRTVALGSSGCTTASVAGSFTSPSGVTRAMNDVRITPLVETVIPTALTSFGAFMSVLNASISAPFFEAQACGERSAAPSTSAVARKEANRMRAIGIPRAYGFGWGAASARALADRERRSPTAPRFWYGWRSAWDADRHTLITSAGYALAGPSPLHESRQSAVFRARRDADGARVRVGSSSSTSACRASCHARPSSSWPRQRSRGRSRTCLRSRRVA